jgi:intracellular sulfur oxidation DsrE/DsrF family protein
MLRRAFLSHLTGTAALVGGGQAVAPSTPAAPAPGSPWTPARHALDEWMDQIPGKHRVVFDTFMADHFGLAVAFAGNQFRMNKEAYGLQDSDLAMIMVVRHGTGPYVFNEAMWSKYGTIFAENMSVADAGSRPKPEHPYLARLTTYVKQGMHFAVCNLTTSNYARMVAKKNGTDFDAAYKELTTNAIGNAHFVSAGVVAVTRAQEYGYALVTTG